MSFGGGDIFDGSSASNTGGTGTDFLNDGDYEGNLRIEKLEVWKSQKNKNNLMFRATFTVTESVNGHEEGDRKSILLQLEGNKHDSYDRENKGAVRRLLGAIAGMSDPKEIDAKIKGADLATAVDPTQPFTGTLVSCDLKSKRFGVDGRYQKPVFRPATGVAPSVTQTKAVVPPPPAVAAPAANRFTEANGFYPHTGMEPGHVYNAAGEIYHVATGKKVA